MKIQLGGKHYLNSDTYCYWITCMVKSKDGKPYEKRVSGYTATFNDAVSSYIERAVKRSVSEDIRLLRDEIESLKREVMGWVIEDEKIRRQDT